MNLSDRLKRRTPLGYGQRFHFSYRRSDYWDKAGLIYIVAERYAERYGSLTEAQANVLYERLAKKYCVGIGWRACLKSVEAKIDPEYWGEFIRHPASEREKSDVLKREQFQKNITLQQIRSSVDYETRFSSGPYAAINSVGGCCRICGKHTFYRLFSDKLPYGITDCRITQKSGVCRRPLCKALSIEFPEIVNGTSKFPMAKILLELTKNGDRTDRIRKIEAIASRDIYRFHNRKSEKRASKDSCSIGE